MADPSAVDTNGRFAFGKFRQLDQLARNRVVSDQTEQVADAAESRKIYVVGVDHMQRVFFDIRKGEHFIFGTRVILMVSDYLDQVSGYHEHCGKLTKGSEFVPLGERITRNAKSLYK